MNIDVADLFIIIALSMSVVGILSYVIAKSRSTSPKTATLLGVVFAIVPIVGIIYLIILWQKPKLTNFEK